MSIDILSILCDPITKEALNSNYGVLQSMTSTYPVVNNIPILLPNEEDRIKEVEKLKSGKDKIGFSWALKHWEDLQINTLLGTAPENAKTVLNFGSGSPLEKKEMEKQGYEVVSMDINAKYKGVDVIADGHFLPFKDNSFDTITAFEVLEHLSEPWVAIKEINRVLKDGGRFVGSVAFLKEYHASYFHMSFLGVIQLMKYGGFEVTRVYGGQSIYSRLVHNVLPLGSKKMSEAIYNALDWLVMTIRKNLWAMKHKKKYTQQLEGYIPGLTTTFEEFDRLKFAPTVLFSAKKLGS